MEEFVIAKAIGSGQLKSIVKVKKESLIMSKYVDRQTKRDIYEVVR